MGWHARRDQGASQEGSGLSRRTITKGAAWATPLLVTSVAAPAYAASGPCVGGQASLTSGTKPTLLQFLPSTVTATIGWSSTGAAGNDQTPGDTGEVHAVTFSAELEVSQAPPSGGDDAERHRHADPQLQPGRSRTCRSRSPTSTGPPPSGSTTSPSAPQGSRQSRQPMSSAPERWPIRSAARSTVGSAQQPVT